MTADIYSYTFKYFDSGLPVSFRETFRIPSGTRAFHLLAYGSAYGPAYGEGFHCLRCCLQALLTALAEH